MYDALDRLTRKTYPDSSQVEYVYDLVGKIQQVNDPTGTYSFAYDDLGRLIATETAYSFLTSRTFTVEYEYDAASNRTQMTDPESGVTSYAYDDLNRLATLTPPAAFTSGTFGFSYDALSRRTQMTRPNSVTTDYAYDNLSRLLSVLHKLSGNTIDGANYTVDAVGNRTAKANQLPSGPTENYTYDSIYQLTQVAQAGPTTTESYTYDAVGNRTASLGASPWSYNSSNHLTAIGSGPDATFTYDNNGNTTSKTDASGTTSYTWDYENRLASVTLPNSGGTVSFTYDPLGRRIRKVFGGATTIYAYDGENIVEETDASGNAVARYAMGLSIDEPLAMLRSSATHYYSADGLGSITSLTDGSGAVAASYTYDTFGNLAGSSGSLTNPFRYTAREWDAETALYFYRARYYDQVAGRFLSEDPLRHLAASPSFYTYVGNNAPLLVDPSGLSQRDIQKMKEAFQRILERLTKEGKRHPNPVLNNMSAAWDLAREFQPFDRFKPSAERYLGCGEQAYVVEDGLTGGQFDDTWTFEVEDYGPAHKRLRARSSSPEDPDLILDPWFGEAFTVNKGEGQYIKDLSLQGVRYITGPWFLFPK